MRAFSRLCAICVGLLCAGVVRGADPIARHFTVVASAAGEVTFRLAGFDADGDALVADITQLPAQGSLTQLSQVFSSYGYEPRAGASVGAAPSRVTGSGNRVNFHRPAAFDGTAGGPWTTVDYTVASPDGTTSRPGRVWILRDSDPATIAVSDFRSGAEGWTVTQRERNTASAAGSQAADSQPVTHDPSRRGSLSRFVHAQDSEVNVAAAGASDVDRWYFVAPAAFHGNQVVAYGGALEFSLASAAGDFSRTNDNAAAVVLECSSCNAHKGRRLLFPLSKLGGFTGAEKAMRVPLVETAGWGVDPVNESVNVLAAPTQCQLVEVLNDLSAVKILGDFTPGWEAVALDTVKLTRGADVPISCYDTIR